MSLDKDFMDFVKDAAFTADPAKEGWVRDFLKHALCTRPNSRGTLQFSARGWLRRCAH